MNDSREPISFYQFLIAIGFTDTGAKELIARRNAFKEQDTDTIPIKRYAKYLREHDKGIGEKYLQDIGADMSRI